MLFGLLTFTLAVRFMAEGWVERAFVTPTYFLSFWGFDWIRVLPPPGMYAVFVAIAVASLGIALGLFYRASIATFFFLFTYVELVDVTNYLNHHYLVSLLALLMCFMPLGSALSIDARRRPESRRVTLPAWMAWLLRFQVGVVYLYASVAKMGPDWLVHGQPLELWLAARTDLPVIGAMLDAPGVALSMSWAGFLYDALIVPAMLWRRTRPWAFMTAVVFHGLVGALFNIGMFPWIMLLALTVFFSPSWPRRWLSNTPNPPTAVMASPPPWTYARRLAAVGLALYVSLQLLVPARAFCYGGDVLWHEQGMRFAWKVMVREKNGSVTYRVRSDRWPREKHVPPSRFLTSHQEREMSAQPDQILRLAHHLAAQLRAEGHRQVEVRVDALASLNGRRMKPLIHPEVDLTTIDDGVGHAGWITAAPAGPPLALRPLRRRPELGGTL